MANKVILDREERLSHFNSEVNFDSVTYDAIHTIAADIMKVSDTDSGLIQLDGILSDAGEKAFSLSEVIASSIMDVADRGVAVDAVKLDQAFAIAKQIADEADFDAIGNVSGGEVLASFIKMNIYTILSSDVPFAGDIADLIPIAGSRDNTKFQILGAESIVTGAMGEFAVGDNISGVNAGNTFAVSERTATQVTATTVLAYTFDLKAIETDVANSKMERGTNEVIVGAKLYINDYDVSSSESVAKRIIVDGGITYTATFDYANGTITLDLSADVAVGTEIIMTGALSADVISKITGTIESDIRDYTYVAVPVSIDTKVNSLKARQILQSTGLSLVSNDLSVALSKVSEEIKAMKVRKALQFSKPFGEVVDLAAATESTITDKYKHAVIRIEEARSEIITKSGITSNIVLVGGTGLVTLFTGLTTDGGRGAAQNGENGIRLLGYINNTIACYFNPLHDTQYPAVDTTHSIFVVGNPADPTKKAAVSGVGLPIMPDNISTDIDSNKVTRLLGKIVVSSNKDARSKELVKKLSIKF